MFDSVLFGNRIKYFLKARKLTYKEFAELSGVDYHMLTYIIAGKTKQPTVSVIIALLKALNLTYSELLDVAAYEKSIDMKMIDSLKTLENGESEFMAFILSQLKARKAVPYDCG